MTRSAHPPRALHLAAALLLAVSAHGRPLDAGGQGAEVIHDSGGEGWHVQIAAWPPDGERPKWNWSRLTGLMPVQLVDLFAVEPGQSEGRRWQLAIYGAQALAPTSVGPQAISAHMVVPQEVPALTDALRRDRLTPLLVDVLHGTHHTTAFVAPHVVVTAARPEGEASTVPWDLESGLPIDRTALARIAKRRREDGWVPYDLAGTVTDTDRSLLALWTQSPLLDDWQIEADLDAPALARMLANHRRGGRSLVQLCAVPVSGREPGVRTFAGIWARDGRSSSDRWVIDVKIPDWEAAHARHTHAGLVPRAGALTARAGVPRISMSWGERTPVTHLAAAQVVQGADWTYWSGVPIEALNPAVARRGPNLPKTDLGSVCMYGRSAARLLEGFELAGGSATAHERGGWGHRSVVPEPLPEFRARCELLRGQGQRLFELECALGEDGAPVYLGRWEARDTPQDARTELDLGLRPGEFLGSAAGWLQEGYQPLDVDVTGAGDAARVHVIWAPSPATVPTDRAEVDELADFVALQTALVKRRESGWALWRMASIPSSTTDRWIAIWRRWPDGQLRQQLSQSATEAEWQQELMLRKQGRWTPLDLVRGEDHAGPQRAALWTQGATGDLGRVGATRSAGAGRGASTADWALDVAVRDSTFQARVDAQVRAGAYPMHVERRYAADGLECDAIWWSGGTMGRLYGTTPRWWMRSQWPAGDGTWEQEHQAHVGQELSLVRYDLCPERGDSARTIAALWTRLGQPTELDAALPNAVFAETVERRRAAGWIPHDVDWKGESQASALTSLVWLKSERPVAWRLERGLTAAALRTLAEQEAARGLGVRRLEALVERSELRFGALLVEEQGRMEWALDLDLDGDTWRDRARSRAAEHWLPIDLARATAGKRESISIVWVRPRASAGPK